MEEPLSTWHSCPLLRQRGCHTKESRIMLCSKAVTLDIRSVLGIIAMAGTGTVAFHGPKAAGGLLEANGVGDLLLGLSERG